MDISAGHLAAATLSAVLLALAYGAIAVLLGAATGKRALAIGVTAAAAVAAYLVNGLAPLVHALEVPQKLSPFYHYAAGDPLRHGVSLSHLAVLVAIAVVATARSVAASGSHSPRTATVVYVAVPVARRADLAGSACLERARTSRHG